MKIPQVLPITPLQSKAARYQLGLTQANVIEESGLPGHKLKSFETGRFIPDMKFLQGLQGFYEGKGISLSELQTDEQGAPLPSPAPAPHRPGEALVQTVPGMVFRVSDAIPQEKADAFLELMDANDERIAAIVKEPVESGFLSEFSEKTDGLVRELFGLLALNHLAFRALQGRDLVTPKPKDDSQRVIADVLATFIAAGPMGTLLGAGEPEQIVAGEPAGGTVQP